jgi:hypothetical protein
MIYASCSSGQTNSNSTFPDKVADFGSYWYQGEAELNSYDLQQARYGEIHDGTAVMIFVTEDFSRSQHVKLDDPAAAGKDKVNVLKLNHTRNFTTGIYPYSMMTSVFTPTTYQQNTLKVTTSSQEWCGHTFTQIDLDANNFDGVFYSYFEAEGSKSEFSLDKVWLEDEIWNLIRINPEILPSGRISILPSLMIQRLRHSEFIPVEAEASHSTGKNGARTFSLKFENGERELHIHYESNFPFRILGWEDTYRDGRNQEKLTTRAALKETLKLDYWNHNSNNDEVLREKLGLE